jgi:hypothetical protein
MERPSTQTAALPEMVVGRSYSWDELGQAFEFKPALLQVAGETKFQVQREMER